MLRNKKKSKLNINDNDSLTFLIQETYNDACNQQKESDKAIRDLVNNTTPVDVDDHTKIAKEKSNLLKIKDSAIKIKLELSKLNADIIKSNKTPVDNNQDKAAVEIKDFQKVRDMLKNGDFKNSITNMEYDTE